MAVFLKKDDTFLQFMQIHYQQGLLNLCQRFNQSKDIELARKRDYIRNYLCILPYFEFQDGAKLDVPCFDNEQASWKLKAFKINKIALNQQYFWMDQADLCFAYGLEKKRLGKKFDSFWNNLFMWRRILATCD